MGRSCLKIVKHYQTTQWLKVIKETNEEKQAVPEPTITQREMLQILTNFGSHKNLELIRSPIFGQSN